ncbi:MAG TPA: amidohydrolase family protein [Pirellulales bacterium]|jgi:predicted TIM-barrel fold metal-dependent hydrolase|nr:amidohydrolase family protein [Pirellulales bacterium]
MRPNRLEADDAPLTRRAALARGTAAVAGAAIVSQAHGWPSVGFAAPGASFTGAIDAHVHVWTPDTERYPLAEGFTRAKMRPPSFTPEELLSIARPSGVERIVLIQMSFYQFDNAYMLDTIKRFPGTFSGVAIVDTTVDDPAEAMIALVERGVRGFRISPSGATPDEWLTSEGMAALWLCAAENRLAVCPLVNPEYLDSIDKMCDKYTDTRVVIDHFARIGADGTIRESDLKRLCNLAQYQNVHVKLSAFYALGAKRPPYTDLIPMIRRLLDAYGPQRLMWASDCPFQVQNGQTYEESIALVRDRLELSEGDRRWLLRETAAKVYFS